MIAVARKTFTPGPWQVSGIRQSSDKYKGHMVGPDGDGVVVVPYNDKDHIECLANARLIAAAPEMYDVLKEAADCLAEIYAKYSLKIGPFSSQAQRINGVIQRTLNKVDSPTTVVP